MQKKDTKEKDYKCKLPESKVVYLLLICLKILNKTKQANSTWTTNY